MDCIWGLFFLLLLGLRLGAHAQTSYSFKRSYYTPPTAHYYHQSSEGSAYPAISYSSDSAPEASKRKEYAKAYPKKIPFRPFGSEEEDLSLERFNSAEWSNESPSYASKENDSREYSIGTQIRVQHPITAPKKSTSPYPKHHKYTSISPYKTNSYSDLNLSSEVPETRPHTTKKHSQKYVPLYEPDPFHLVSPPKVSAPTAAASTGYNVYEHEEEEYEVTPPASRTKSALREHFKGVASKKQIEKYLEDQQKMLDEALKLQLLNSPKFQQLLKNKENEHFDEDYEQELSPPLPPFRHNFNDNPSVKPIRNRRRPQGGELKRSPKGRPNARPKRKFRSAIVISV